MKQTKKSNFNFLTWILVIALICSSLVPAVAHTQEAIPMQQEIDLPIEAESAILVEAHNNQVLYNKNATEPMHPASLTKIMTLLLAGEALDEEAISWDDRVTVSLAAYEMDDTGSIMYLDHDDEVTVEELIKGIAIISANDGCVALAEHIAGSEERFVQLMNERAEELGLENTNFTNSHGLHDDNQYMSALDVARLASYFIRTQPEIAAYQAEREWTYSDIKQFNRNPLLRDYEGADGIKTGYLSAAGWCLAATAERDDFRLISVVLNSPTEEDRGIDSQSLLDFGFNNYELVNWAAEGEEIDSVPVIRGVEETVPVAPTEDVEVVIPGGQSEHITKNVIPREEIEAPIEEGEQLGLLNVYYDDELLLETHVAATQDLERQGFFAYLWSSITGFFSGIWQSIFGSENGD